jgi:metal-responsive CopG/Arc/MetJ family transcriptional regulator
MWMNIMKTIQMTIDQLLLERVDKATDSLGMTRSAFIRRALESALQDLAISELERKHIEGYQRQPVQAGEFDMWESDCPFIPN